ncbi:rust resistance kinase Lr10-like, partial [Pistacia vera]|uniref:rust resistance kinase Lr10-like n=1 Tax=Pistacia vera TaxID=55513 RepID=UPI00126356FB
NASVNSLYFAVGFSVVVPVVLICRFIVAQIVLVVYLIFKYRTRRKKVDTVEKFLHNQQSWRPKRYTYPELMAVTNNFKEKLGQGGFGSIYKGILHSGSLIAVKVLENSKFSTEEFINEVSTIGRIHHINVVHLVGFCSEGSKHALVYEYMPNGSLDKHIFSKAGRSLSFSWDKLYEIALATARGIEYLHKGHDVCILHFDIKPHNILLDQNFIPKVSDFGLAKFYPKENDFVTVSATRGTIGYIAPELISRNFGTVSSKSDVYSFGMLLLEMVGGRRNSDMKAAGSGKAYFPSWVYDQIDTGGDLELQEHEVVIAKKLCLIGLWCIQVKPSDRPSITKVIEMLEGSIDNLQLPAKPLFSSSEDVSIRMIQSDYSTGWLLSKSMEEYSYNSTDS